VQSLDSHILQFVPTGALILRVAPVAILYGAAMGALVGWLRIQRNVRTPYTRKVFHFSIFTGASIVQIVWGLPGVVVYGVAVSLIVLFAVWRGNGFPFYEALARATDEPHRRRFILIPLLTTAIGGGIGNLLFAQYAFIGYLVAGWGDAVGEPVGTRWGRHRFRVPSLYGVQSTRSVEGSTAVFVVGTLAAFVGAVAAGVSAGDALRMATAAGAAGAVVEAFSPHGLDNLTVQVAATAMAALVAA
jgi:phytol kinase